MRFGCLTLVLLVLSLILISCTKEVPDFKEIDVQKPPVIEELHQNENEIPDEALEKARDFTDYIRDIYQKYGSTTEALSQKEKITSFLDALSSGNTELVDYYLNGWGHENFKDVEMTYEIISVDSVGEYDDCNATVLFNITNSTSPAFPEGEHTYNITSRYVPDPCYITLRKSDEDLTDNIPEEKDEKLSDALIFGDRYLDFCFNVTKESPNYYFIKELMKLDLYEKFILPNGGFTLEELREHMKDRFGGDDESYPEIEEMFAPAYNEESGKYVYSYGQCGEVQARKVSKVEKTDKGYRITYECFSDMSYLQKCMELTLVFEENENSDIMRLERIDRNIIIGVPMQTYSP